MGYFKDVTPESAGISSKGILNFLDRIEENQIELHSFMDFFDNSSTEC